MSDYPPHVPAHVPSRLDPGRPRPSLRVPGWISPLLGLALAACGGYARETAAFRSAVEDGHLDEAYERIDELVLAAEAEGSEGESSYPLLLLERASVEQALGAHDSAVTDFGEADQRLEILDLTSQGAKSVGRYLWSDDITLYRPPVYEKLMVNMSALSSYLALGQYREARVEARRITVLTDYFAGTDLARHPALGAAWVLAGLAMELSGERDSALRYYLDAFELVPTPQLADWIVRLSAGSGLSRQPGVGQARELLGLGQDELPPPHAEQEVVVLVFSGLAPRRESTRFPIGIVWAWMTDGGFHLTNDQETTLERLRAEELLTWVNFPTLVVRPTFYDHFRVDVDGAQSEAVLLADMEVFALDQWEHDRGLIALAAITRAITRVLAREAIQAIGRASGGEGSRGADAAFIVSLLVEGAMQAADRPDTRTWSTMASAVSVARLGVPPGAQTLHIRSSGPAGSRTDTVTVDVPAGGSDVVTLRLLP